MKSDPLNFDDNITPRQLEQKLFTQAYRLNASLREYRLAERTWRSLYNLKDEMFERVKFKHNKDLDEKGKNKTNAQLEREATLDKEWLEYRQGLDAAEEKMADTKVNHKVCETNWETTRSILSSRNCERRSGT